MKTESPTILTQSARLEKESSTLERRRKKDETKLCHDLRLGRAIRLGQHEKDYFSVHNGHEIILHSNSRISISDDKGNQVWTTLMNVVYWRI